jgi:hypothetical protein
MMNEDLFLRTYYFFFPLISLEAMTCWHALACILVIAPHVNAGTNNR